jgi:8-oxo-dGTP pyrophosphatase MutT (NUDIX family)
VIKKEAIRVAAVVVFILLFVGCGQRQMTGVVQNSKWVNGGWELPLGTGDKSDYIFIEHGALMDMQGAMITAGNPRNLFLLGHQYVGKKIRVTGDVERDGIRRKFIRVARRDQIEIL